LEKREKSSPKIFGQKKTVRLGSRGTEHGQKSFSLSLPKKKLLRQNKKQKKRRKRCLLPGANRVGDFSSRKRSADRSSPAPAGTAVRFISFTSSSDRRRRFITVSLVAFFVLVFRIATIESLFVFFQFCYQMWCILTRRSSFTIISPLQR
jgi:hypothetical protein